MIARLLALFLGFLAMTVSSGEGENRGTLSEFAAALDADLDSERGAEPYQPRAACHQSTGWGVLDGSVPQVAGQTYEALLTQISDFRDRERIHPMMMPFVSNHYLAGPQNLAYVAALPPATRSSTETGQDLERGRQPYQDSCGFCHGLKARGNAVTRVPRLAGQHYPYVARQIRWISRRPAAQYPA